MRKIVKTLLGIVVIMVLIYNSINYSFGQKVADKNIKEDTIKKKNEVTELKSYTSKQRDKLKPYEGMSIINTTDSTIEMYLNKKWCKTEELFNLFSCECNGGTIYVSPNDYENEVFWDNGDNKFCGANNNDDGLGNTFLIVNFHGDGFYAAKVCDDLVLFGYDDWYLPSYSELMCVYENRKSIRDLKKDGLYWSSTEYNKSKATSIDFGMESLGYDLKSELKNVRCIRK